MSAAGHSFFDHEPGILNWLTTRDHKKIGIMYFYSIAFFFLIGGLAALGIRLELFSSGMAVSYTHLTLPTKA